MSIGVSVGLCSAMGLLFGTAHMTLPFLLLGKAIEFTGLYIQLHQWRRHYFDTCFPGIGVDDLFIIVQSWSNISSSVHRGTSIEERIGLALKHSVSSSLILDWFFGKLAG